jgi:TolB protein
MRSVTSIIAAIAALLVCLYPHSAAAQLPAPGGRGKITFNISGAGGQVWPIAVSGLKNDSGDDSHALSSRFDETLSRDLELSGYYRILDPHTYIEDPQKSGYDVGQFNFADWSSINAAFLVKGVVKNSGNQVQLTAMLFDVYQQRRVMGKSFTGSTNEVPRMARRFADAVLKAVTGTQGPFDCKLAYVSTRAGRFKEIFTQSIDGQDLYQVTNNPTINLFPGFDRNASQLLYLSYKTMSPALYVANLAERREAKIDSRHGRIIGGAISPNGQSVVAAIESNGTTNLYLMDREGHEISELTRTNGINVSPTFSADGETLAFTSDRSGSPQIYTMPSSGGSAHRVTYSGNYNTTPAFSPKGDLIAYQTRSGGRFDICVIPKGGGQPTKLTNGEGSNESPAWSPDGRYLAFSSTRAGHAHIYILQVESRKVISALTEDNGNDTNPAWSWWLGE